jgi:UDP-N-acetylglucosamine 2-epimerase (non-hydrolysing)
MIIGIIFGTRPEAIKLIPVYQQLKKNPHFNTFLICTGQHDVLIKHVLDFFNVKPDFNLHVMKERQSLAFLSSQIILKLDQLIINRGIEGIIIQGDTTSAMIGSLAGFYHKVKIIHVEAGLRSGNKYSPYPEEINRKIISQVTDIHFTPTPKASDNLKLENTQGNIVLVGNTIVDSLLYAKDLIQQNLENYNALFRNIIKENKKFVLITIHRRENYENNLIEIFSAIKYLADKYKELDFIFPRHLNPIILEHSEKHLGHKENVYLIDALQYDHFLFLLMKSYMVISDSGGIQEEAPSFNKPVLIIRDTTERPELIEAGGGILCGTKSASIIQNFERLISSQSLFNKMCNIDNPFGDGTSSVKIVNYLSKIAEGIT